MNIVFLPATDPDDETFGSIPHRIDGHPGASVWTVRFPTMVWYNALVRQNAISQIRSWGIAPIVLVGFSKSGLGAWNIARAMPDCISGTVIFDAPVARAQLPPWGTEAFYGDDAAWQGDLPLRTVRAFDSAVPDNHRLILISGQGFHEEMRTLSDALWRLGRKHDFLDRPEMRHHWDSGWIAEGMKALLGSRVGGDVESRGSRLRRRR